MVPKTWHFAHATGAPVGAYPLPFVTPGIVTDAVESSGGLHVAVSHKFPTAQHDRYVARIGGSGRLVWRSPLHRFERGLR